MTEEPKPDDEIEGTPCHYCIEAGKAGDEIVRILPEWEMRPYDGYVVWVDTANNDAFVHRHNFSYGEHNRGKTRPKEKEMRRAASSVERDLLAEYFKKPGEAPASAKILAQKAAGGDIASLRELHKRYGSDQPGKYDIPVQIAIEGGKPGDHRDPRPIMNLKKGLLSEAWDKEDEQEYIRSEQDIQ